MLPNLKFLIGGILFCLLLFVAAGAGVMLPDARTHFGETPEIGRPLMQQSMAEASPQAPPQAQFYMMTVIPRSDESEPPRERATEQTAVMPARPEPDPPKAGLLRAESPTSGLSQSDPLKQESSKPDVMADVPAEDAAAAHAPADGAPGDDPAAPAQAVPPAETRNDDRPAAAPQVAALTPPVADDARIAAPFVNVPLPLPRPTVFGLHRHGRLFHRRRRLTQQHDIFGPGVAVGQGVPAGEATSVGHLPTGQSVPASYLPPQGTGRP